VLFAPSAFTGTLSAVDAAAAMSAGWAQTAPGDQTTRLPTGDGGAGFVDVIAASAPGVITRRTGLVDGGHGDPTPAEMLIVDRAAERTVYLEAAQVCGLTPNGAPHEPDPHVASTGVGQLIGQALTLAPHRIVVGVGDLAGHDAGAGMLAALGVRGPLTGGAAGLAEWVDPAPRQRRVLADDLARVRAQLAGVQLVAAVDEPASVLAPAGRHGATPSGLSVWSVFVDVTTEALGGLAADLLGGGPRLARALGSGAGGGLGFGLSLIGARLRSGVQVVAEAIGLDEALTQTDLVVAGEGCFDWRSLRDSVVSDLAARALTVGVPVIVVAGRVEVGRRESTSIGVESCYPVADTDAQLLAALRDPFAALTWSR
jgi:glycerate kinase